jgi:hypothetical protein
VADIAAQNEGVIGRLALQALVGDEGKERDRGQFHLLVGHLVELGDGDLDGVLELLEIG